MSVVRRLGLALPLAWRVYGAFFLYAFSMGGIFPRLPEIQRGLGVAEGALGLALIGTACGTLVSLTFAGAWIERIGHRRALLGLLMLLPVMYAIASLATGPVMLFLLLLPAGLCIGAVEIIVNLEADRVEHVAGRRIMNRAHAFWSAGFFASGLLGAALSQRGLSPQWHLALTVPLVAAGVVLVLGRFDAAAHRHSTGTTAHFARPTLGVMMLVAVTLSAMVLEGASADWSAIYMRDVFDAEPFIAGAAVATGAAAQAITRFFADSVVERFQPLPVARTLIGVLGAGATLVLLAPSAVWGLVGFALIGVGTSALFPLAMSAAAQRTDRSAATNVASLAQTSFVAFLLGPPLLGYVAESFGLRWAFGACLPLVVLSLLTSSALRGPR